MTTDYRRRREDRLTTLLADPYSWRYIAQHALDVRATHDHGTPAWSTLTRLHNVAQDILRLADDT